MKKTIIAATLLAVSVGSFAALGPAAPTSLCLRDQSSNLDPSLNAQLSYPGGHGPASGLLPKDGTTYVCMHPYDWAGAHTFRLWSESHGSYGSLNFTACSRMFYSNSKYKSNAKALTAFYTMKYDSNYHLKCVFDGTSPGTR